MELWYSEFHTGNVKLSVRINRQLFSGESEFQRISGSTYLNLLSLENL